MFKHFDLYARVQIQVSIDETNYNLPIIAKKLNTSRMCIYREIHKNLTKHLGKSSKLSQHGFRMPIA